MSMEQSVEIDKKYNDILYLKLNWNILLIGVNECLHFVSHDFFRLKSFDFQISLIDLWASLGFIGVSQSSFYATSLTKIESLFTLCHLLYFVAQSLLPFYVDFSIKLDERIGVHFFEKKSTSFRTLFPDIKCFSSNCSHPDFHMIFGPNFWFMWKKTLDWKKGA